MFVCLILTYEFHNILYLSKSGKINKLLKSALLLVLLLIVFPLVICNGHGQTEPPPIIPKEQLCSFDGITYGPCLEPPPTRISGIDNSDFDAAFLGVMTVGIIAGIAGIAVAISKGSFGKSTPKGNYQFTKSALQSYQSDFTKKYSGKPSWMDSETNTYGYGTAKSTESPSSPIMNHGDFDFQNRTSSGITNPPPANPSPTHVTYQRTPNSINLKWDPPIQHDTSEGVQMRGYDVYYQEKTPTGWITQHIALPNTHTVYSIQNTNTEFQNLGVRCIYTKQDGTIFYSDGIQGTS